MRGILLASVSLVTGSAAPPAPPAPPERAPPCEKPAGEDAGKAKKGLVQSDKPNAAQRVIPGLF